MGGQKQKWTAEEEEALKAGVAKHGIGKWKNILTDPEFAHSLANRSNIDLKDKWRNLGMSSGAQTARDKALVMPLSCVPLATAPNTANALALVEYNGTTAYTPRSPQDGVTVTTKRMIFEALSSIKDSRGSDFNTIASFIEQKHEVPFNFRRSLSSVIRRLTMQGLLEKVDQCYKINDSSPSTRISRARKPKPGLPVNIESLNPETLEGAANIAAYRIVEAETKSTEAAEAMEEAEKISAMAEESRIMLEVVKGICKQFDL